MGGANYLTAFQIEDTFPGRPVTLHHLLTHTAGFEDNIVGAAVEDPARHRRRVRQLRL